MEIKYNEIIRIINEKKSVPSDVSVNFANTVTLLIEKSRDQQTNQLDQGNRPMIATQSKHDRNISLKPAKLSPFKI